MLNRILIIFAATVVLFVKGSTSYAADFEPQSVWANPTLKECPSIETYEKLVSKNNRINLQFMKLLESVVDRLDRNDPESSRKALEAIEATRAISATIAKDTVAIMKFREYCETQGATSPH